jgi:hypothetical protein
MDVIESLAVSALNAQRLMAGVRQLPENYGGSF